MAASSENGYTVSMCEECLKLQERIRRLEAHIKQEQALTANARFEVERLKRELSDAVEHNTYAVDVLDL